jgi:hypothetical protein
MPNYRLYPTGLASEAWRVEHDGVHVGDVTLTIHANGWGKYQIKRWDRPDLVALRAQLVRDGAFAFDVWDRARVVDILTKIVREGARGAEVDVAIKRPFR